MATLKHETLQFNDAIGRVEAGAKIYAYDAVATTTMKQTYTTRELSTVNEWPVVAGSDGRFPVIWLADGGYYIEVRTSDEEIIDVWEDVNLGSTIIDTTAAIYFETLTDAKVGTAITGDSVSLEEGQIVRTQGKVTGTDGIGGEWVVVAGGTGTADDDLYADLNNGKQIQRLFNQLYTAKNLDDLADKSTARANLGVDITQQIFTSSGTWTRPIGCRKIKVELVGAGGGGGGSGTGNTGVGAGGGGGGYLMSLIDVTSLPTETVSVPSSGGAGGAATGTNGASGGSSSFGALIAGGGSGGTGRSNAGRVDGGAGGTLTGGDFVIIGGFGGGGYGYNSAAGPITMSGHGGSSHLSNMATSVWTTFDTSGWNGPSHGGGGSGAVTAIGGGSGAIGGQGAGGVCIVTEYY